MRQVPFTFELAQKRFLRKKKEKKKNIFKTAIEPLSDTTFL